MSTQDGKWWTKSWNPIRVKGGGWHCTKISPGCSRCWAEAINIRFGNGEEFTCGKGEGDYFPGFELYQSILEAPLHWRKPQVIAVQWLGDLFHEQIPNILIEKILLQLNEPQRLETLHTYLILTKRIERVLNFTTSLSKRVDYEVGVPPHVWLGVSICNQQEADEKIPILLQTPAAHRFVNLGPMLEGVDIAEYLWEEDARDTGYPELPGLDWITLECESGPGRRPMKLEWARSVVEQCTNAGIPLWIKQLPLEKKIHILKSVNHYPGFEHTGKYRLPGEVSKNMAEWPEDLRIRQLPF
jgi:protein gp37